MLPHTLLSLFASEGNHDVVEWLIKSFTDDFFDSVSYEIATSSWRRKCDPETLLKNKYPFSEIAAGYAMGDYFKNEEAIIRTLCSIEDDNFRYLLAQEARYLIDLPPIEEKGLYGIVRNLRYRINHSSGEDFEALIQEGLRRLQENKLQMNEEKKRTYCCLGMFATAVTVAIGTAAIITKTYTP